MKAGIFKNNNRKAAVAGQFYPGNKSELKKQLSELFQKTKTEQSEKRKLQAIISPHAGYVFSGEVAASAFNEIPENSNYKRVFVIASSHQYYFNGASIYCEGDYETPLGEIKVDTTLAKQLTESCAIFTEHTEAHLQEHSLEVQLPFLQFKLGSSFKLVPIILGTNSASDCKKIAAALKPWFTPENLFVISSDFSHYPKSKNALEIDTKTAEAICTNQPEKLLAVLDENKTKGIKNLATSLCGWTSVLTLLYLTENKAYRTEKIKYQNSGDSKIYGDKTRVVGYWSIGVFLEKKLMEITSNEKLEILEKSRNSIKEYVTTGKKGKLVTNNSAGILNEQAGVFVSVYIKNELRGCIGGFPQEKTLNELVQNMAASAACDSRFKKVEVDELDNMELEISVLSPLKEIKSIDEIVLGKHGIFIRQGYNTGTFLPQVAEKTGWNLEQFLGHCARDKAGIGWSGWKTAELFIYEAIIFRGK